MLLQDPPHPPTCLFQVPRLSLGSRLPCLDLALGGPVLQHQPLMHPLLQLPRKHGPIARDGEVVTGKHPPVSQSPRLFNKNPLRFQVTPFPSMHL